MSRELYSLQNPNTAKLDLYVMQNMHGLIKIGRSSSPERRRLQLEQQGRCPVAIVLTVPAYGHHEERLHLLLGQFSLGGEWFSGDEKARQAVCSALGATVDWPYPHDAVAAAEWLDKQRNAALARYWRKRERHLVANLKAASIGYGNFNQFKATGWSVLDLQIAGVFGLDGGSTMFDTLLDDGGRLIGGYRLSIGGTYTEVEIPPYTRSMDAANTLWLPEDADFPRRPVQDALDCCFAALCNRWAIDETKIKPRDTW